MRELTVYEEMLENYPNMESFGIMGSEIDKKSDPNYVFLSCFLSMTVFKIDRVMIPDLIKALKDAKELISSYTSVMGELNHLHTPGLFAKRIKSDFDEEKVYFINDNITLNIGTIGNVEEVIVDNIDSLGWNETFEAAYDVLSLNIVDNSCSCNADNYPIKASIAIDDIDNFILAVEKS